MKYKLQTQTFSVFLLFFVVQLFAQQSLKKIDSMLINIDKSTLTTNVLYERVFPWAMLNTFNDDINIANGKYFEQALSELYKASNKQKFVSLKKFRTQYTAKENYSTTDIGIINARFHKLNYNTTNVKESALKIKNNKFKKINNGKKVFLSKEVLIISPIKYYLTGNTITYHFNTSFLVQENTKTITNIIANFGNSKDYTIYDNGSFTENVNINYSTTGEKILTFSTVFSDGTSQTTQALVYVKLASLNYTPARRWSSTSASNPNDFKFMGINGLLEYRIFYAYGGGANTGYDLASVHKPILLVDGFDPLDKRKIQDSDPHDGTDKKHVSIENLMQYKNNQNDPVFIIEELNSDGYDVIIINHPEYHVNGEYINGGADYIERNGLTHASFYQEINRNLAINGSNEELVIMGPSMGGLISRYALAYMEKKEFETGLNKWQHNTRLWVSIDSPHLGANIPIGVQSLLNQLKDGDNEDASDFVNDELGSPAAKQMLIEQFSGFNSSQLKSDYLDGRTISQGYSIDRGRPEFINFYNNLFNNGLQYSKGYPQNLKKIALVNGSLTSSKKYIDDDGVSHFYPLSEQITTNVRVFQRICLPWPFCFKEHVGTSESYGMPTYGVNHKVSRFKKMFNDKSKFITNINSRGVLDNGSGGFFPVYDIILNGIDGSDPLPFPEGTFKNWGNFGDTIYALISNLLGGVDGAYMSVRANQHVASFIPTPSALGMLQPDYYWNNDINRNLVCSNETPFDSYYGEGDNTNHVSFTENKYNWLKGWLNKTNEADPSVYLKADNILGSETICQGDIEVYSFEDCKTSASFTWQVSSNLTIVGSNSDKSVLVKGNAKSGLGFVRAVFENQTIEKEIHIGIPSYPSTAMTGSFSPVTGEYTSYSVPVAEGATSYHWYFDIGGNITGESVGGWQILSGQGSRDIFVKVGQTGITVVVCRATNSCGNTIKYKYVEVQNAGSGVDPCDELFKFSSNPMKSGEATNKILIVDEPCEVYNSVESTRTNTVKHTITIFSKYGVKVYSKTQYDKEFSISHFKEGIYIVKYQGLYSNINGRVVTKKLIID